MKIRYNLLSETYSYEQNKEMEVEKLNFILTNPDGDFLNLGVKNNSCKFFGLNMKDPKSDKIFKFIDEIIPKGIEVCEVEYKGYKVIRKFKGKVLQKEELVVDEKNRADQTFGDKGELNYDSKGRIVEEIETDVELNPSDSFFLGPTGGLVYEIQNFSGELFLDLDMREKNDFNEWGRDYKISNEKDVIIVELNKTLDSGKNYNLFLGIKPGEVLFEKSSEWVKKEYSYSKIRNSLWQWYVYRSLKIKVTNKAKIIFGSGFSKDEVLKQIDLLENHQSELETMSKNMFFDLSSNEEFEKPLNQDVNIAYKLSKDAIYGFRHKDSKENPALYAGYPWFSDVWARDEIIALRAFINLNDFDFVKKRILYYLDRISDSTGGIRILQNVDSNTSCDAVFYLTKRIEDLIFKLAEENKLHSVFNDKDLEFIYDKLNTSFSNIIKNNWDFDKELLNVKDADSWMDTIHLDFPLEIQVGLLEMISFMAFLGKVLDKKDESLRYLDLEEGLREKIKLEYFKYDNLYNELYLPKLTCNVFLVYYLYPELFLDEDWERIFDNALKVLKTNWGGISSLSNKEKDFKDEYSGENNWSYHRGDSWFWINNIAAIAMNSLNEKKYRSEVAKILVTSTLDILKYGTIGYASEISSSKEQRAEGSMAQLWSSSTYVEMVDKLFEKK